MKNSKHLTPDRLDIPNLEWLAKNIVEGFITGLHRSPFHGYSAEFREHKIYSPGESIKYIDWKVYAKTDRLYIKKFDEETNMRVRLILDASSSMFYPEMKKFDLNRLNKIGFSVVASAVLNEILKRQRDAVGLSAFHEEIIINIPEKTHLLHRKRILGHLENLLFQTPVRKRTFPLRNLHLIAETLKKRSLTVLFTDFWPDEDKVSEITDALKHLRYKSAELIVFHVTHKRTEQLFDFENKPLRFEDLETGEKISVFPDELKENYRQAYQERLQQILEELYAYGIDYHPVDVETPYSEVMATFLQKRLKMK